MTPFTPEVLTVTGLPELPPFAAGSELDSEGDVVGNHSNTSVADLMLRLLGPQRKDLPSSVLLTTVYSLVFLSGFVGNFCTCVVIAKNNYMHTTTNYYLANLAVSDLMLIIFGLPPEVYTIWESYPWRLGEAFCIFRHTVMEMSSCASVLTITAFTVERYFAICHPLMAHKMANLSRAVKIIIAVWAIAVLAALPYALHTRQFYAMKNPYTLQPIPDSLVCNIPERWRNNPMRYIFQLSTFVFFLTPVTVIICLYILIALALRKSMLSRGLSEESHYGSQSKHTPTKNTNVPKQPRRVVMRILVAVAVAFIICWAPFHAQRLMVLYVPVWTDDLMAVQSVLFYISGVLYFISSTVNPILYNVISKRYRLAFKQTLCCCLQSSHTRVDRNGRVTSDYGHRPQNGNHVSFSNTHAHTKSNKTDGATTDSQRVQLLDAPVSPVVKKSILRNGGSVDSQNSQTCHSPLLKETTDSLTAETPNVIVDQEAVCKIGLNGFPGWKGRAGSPTSV